MLNQTVQAWIFPAHDTELVPILAKCAAVLLICGLFGRFFHDTPKKEPEKDPHPHLPFFHPTREPVHTTVKERVLLLAVTLVYAIISFHKLGSHVLPHTTWQPVTTPQSVVFELYEDTVFDRIMILTGEGDNNSRTDGYQFGLSGFSIDVSDDLEVWETIGTLNEQRFCQYVDTYGYWNHRYVRLTSTDDTDTLTEIAFVNSADQTVLPVRILSDEAEDSRYPASLMIDEQDAVRTDDTYFDETYFDEVYHPRNAWEIAEGQYMYSTVHPLLGTEMIALSIRLFGMNPFAWRLPGALTGTLLIPLFWYLIRLLTDRAEPALLGAALLGTDFMHITTSRIATLEPMSVFFILAMFVFIVRWCRTSFFDRPLSASLKELLFCGIATGLGIAVKWTACFSAAGLAVIYFVSMFFRMREYRKLCAVQLPDSEQLTEAEQRIMDRARQFPQDVSKTILWSVLFFIGIPLVIYFIAYIPCRISRDGWSLRAVADQIRYMYTYHIGLDATHPYQSTWDQWVLDQRPIWYYSKEDFSGAYHTIACFTNPLLSAAGVITILCTFFDAVRSRQPAPIVISIGYLSALAPWFAVERCVFAYHFYPTSFFMIASIVWVFHRIVRSRKWLRYIPVLFAALSLLVFLIYLPVLTGFGTTRDYVHLLEIIPSWYFG